MDFEGLGTFERSLEQDMDLSMVGAAISNSLILRTGNTFDKFIRSRLMDWSEGSRNITYTRDMHYFGGNLIFCQKDVTDEEGIKNEFDGRIRQTIDDWRRRNPDANMNSILGIFSKNFNSPTPLFSTRIFFDTLRRTIIKLIIKDVLMDKSSPNYSTGKEFLLYLKGILATVDIHDYNALDNIAIENLKKYLDSNKSKAFEIFGIYPNMCILFWSHRESTGRCD